MRKLHIGAQNDTRYFIDQPPRPSTDDANPDANVSVIASWDEIVEALAAAGYAVVKALPVKDQNIRALEKVGYAVVPVEPTEAMGKAVLHVLDTVPAPNDESGIVEGIRPIWNAMLAAAKGDAE